MADEQPQYGRPPASRSTWSLPSASPFSGHNAETSLSPFERIISSYPPIFESLLLQLPTSSIINLYHTSECLRLFLQEYPTAWKHLSFRSRSPGRISTRQNSPASDASGDFSSLSSKLYSLDLLLLNVVLPFGTRLKSLELDYTAISGENLSHCVLHTRRETLQHLSVRGCKQVSLKYHIIPFLTLFKLQKSALGPAKTSDLALKSLYTFRCRHHRRRPYTPSSRVRKDSDSAPTHDLVQLCHELGIWTDTSWCPTLGGRCLRRKDYSVGRGTPEAQTEVWVVFDRLWRSGNRLGASKHVDRGNSTRTKGQLWEDAEIGYEGEPLGCESGGKGLPTHLRQSHRIFIENVNCHNCEATIQERCEHCSIRMHCMGCRKTLCQDCAFSRPLPSPNNHERNTGEQFWWTPNASRNPNLMLQEIGPGTSFTNGVIPNSAIPPPIKTQWCCLQPMFSNGGSISFLGPSVRNSSISHIRAAPLPKGKGYEDPEFTPAQYDDSKPQAAAGEDHPVGSHDSQLELEPDQTLQSLLLVPKDSANISCSRNLCQDCWHRPTWKAACRTCKESFCFAHDFRGLNVRICGYKGLAAEKATLEERSKLKDIMVIWERAQKADAVPHDTADGSFLEYLRGQGLSSDSLVTLEAIIPFVKWPLASGDALGKEIDGLLSKTDTIPSSNHDRDIEKPGSPSIGTKNPGAAKSNRWKGCRSFMCPKYRAVGDHRPKCTATAQQCVLCSVHVCPDCLVLEPACDCSYCKDHYRCPNCFDAQKDLCKKVEEDEEKRKKEEAEERQRVEAIQVLEEADEMASLVGEFMIALDHASNLSESEPPI